MEALVNVQNDTFSRISKAKQNYKKSPKERITKQYVETRLDTLEQLWSQFIRNHDEIVKLAKDRKNAYFESDIYESVEELYVEYKSELKFVIDSFAKSVSVPSGEPGSKGSNIPLPKIFIQPFSGLYSEWTTFRNLFSSLVHTNSQLDNVQKMHYLKGYLTGEAEHLLRQIPISESNYERCWALLNSRYNNKRFLSQSILRKMLSQRNVTAESANMLKGLIDTTTDCLSALTNIGVDVSTWDILVIHLLTLKLDSDSRKEWEMYISNLNEIDELPKFSQFEEFLTKRYRALEFLEPKSTAAHKSQNIQAPNVNKSKVFHATQLQCEYCTENHKLATCKKFVKEEIDGRRKFIEQKGLCFNCFGHHSAKFCKNVSCRICNRKHHTLLHAKGNYVGGSGKAGNTFNDGPNSNRVFVSTTGEDVKGSPAEKAAASSSSSGSNSVVTCYSSGHVPIHSQVLLATALVRAESSKGERHFIRALLDQGSQASFVTEAVVQYLGVKKIPVQGRISGLQGSDNISVQHMVQLKIRPRFDSGTEITVQAYILDSITSFLPSKKVVERDCLNWSGICLADPHYHTPNKIDVLLGAEVYGHVIKEGLRKARGGALVAQNTTLGWIISGIVPQSGNGTIVAMHTTVAENDDLLKLFWELEADPKSQTKLLSQEEEECEAFFAQTTCRDSQGRYIVRLPFKRNSNVEFQDSKEIATKRLRSLALRFRKNDVLKQGYSRVIEEYLHLGHMEVVPLEDRNKKNTFYLPHHAVIRADKDTTKLRVVFDASCKDMKGVSLNNTLMVGPNLQPELRHLLMKWRTHPICLAADIVKMYRQIKVAPEDVDYQRLVWDENWASGSIERGNLEINEKSKETIQEYRLLRVTFGMASAPYLAVKVLQQLAVDEGTLYPGTSEKIMKDYYMDDLLSGCQTVEEGIRIYKEMNMLLNKGGFELQKWMTNDNELLERLRQEETGKELGEGLNLKSDEIVKLLGLTWNRRTDDFEYTVTLPPQTGPVTKRMVLSDIARLYDPLGWIGPSIITAKIFIQKLWLAGLNWDQELPINLLKEWKSYRIHLEKLKNFTLPRWVKTKADDQVVELHGFADASSLAYSAVVYLRVIDVKKKVHVSLLTCKTRVAPIKQLSIPRLELCGATLLSKLLKEVSEVLNIDKSHLHAWSDSEVVLAWLSGHPSKWQTFIGNRVSQILSTLDSNQWSHISSSQNPADCASRGLTPSDFLKCKLWFQGPALLHEREIKYSRPKKQETQLEMKRVYFTEVSDAKDKFIWEKYSSLTKLVRVVAYCKRFLNIRKQGTKGNCNVYLSACELRKATNTCIMQCQQEHFKTEMTFLEKNEPNQIKGPLKPLNPFVDSSGLLRVGGRLERSHLRSDMIHPILLPKKSFLTDLIIADAHVRTLHGGPQLMLAYLQARYWILGAKVLVKSHTRKCVTCIKDRAATKNPLMGQLPAARVTPSRAFKCSGVDYAGPINVRTTKGRGNKAYKGYICLFICMATRAIHLEVVSDLTTQGFLAAFKRFVARRGLCTDVWSDNGTNFVGASRELRQLFAWENSGIAQEVAESLASTGTTWHFIPPHSPNFGGLWEAGVKSVKTHLRRVIGEATLTYEELSTVLAQIEACLNSRPLSRLNTDSDAMEVLTPGHFLVGEPLVIPPDNNFENSNVTNLRRWQLTQKIMQHFWRRWSQEYLVKYLHRYRWSYQTPEPQVGDVILVKESDLPPCKWLLGRVVTKHPGPDNITRVVTLRTKNTFIKRPVSKICVLPITE